MASVERNDLREEIKGIYRRRASNYDLSANLYYLIGFPEWRYRKYTIGALELSEGDTVVEIGCGTGLNFGLVEERIGPSGKIIGIDLTRAMLDQARDRVTRNGWKNVELIHKDASKFEFPGDIDGIYSTFALSLIPEGPDIIRRGAKALKDTGRWALLDFQVPGGWPDWLVGLGMLLVKPFTPTDEWLDRKPWPDIQQTMNEALRDLERWEYYLGTTYLMSGKPNR